MENKKKPIRKCVACNNRKEKEFLFRIEKNNNEIKLNINKNPEGRGAYLCKNKDCILQAKKKKALQRSFKQQIDENLYEELLNIFN